MLSDLHPGRGGDVNYRVDADNKTVSIKWHNVEPYSLEVQANNPDLESTGNQIELMLNNQDEDTGLWYLMMNFGDIGYSSSNNDGVPALSGVNLPGLTYQQVPLKTVADWWAANQDQHHHR